MNTSIGLGTFVGKIALVNDQSEITGIDDSNVIDFVDIEGEEKEFRSHLKEVIRETIEEMGLATKEDIEALKKEDIDKYFENKFEDKDNKFLLAFHTVKENCPVAFSRIFSFLVSYGFGRNLCMVFNVYALLFLIKFIYYINSWYFVGFLIAIAFSYIFFRRYYKFLNHHNLEVYYSFYLYAKDK